MKLLSSLQSVLAKVGDFTEQPRDSSIEVAPETYFPFLKFPLPIKFGFPQGPTAIISDSVTMNRADRLAASTGQIVTDLGVFSKGIWDLSYHYEFHNDLVSQTTVYQIQLTDNVTAFPIMLVDVVGNTPFAQIFGATVRLTLDRSDLSRSVRGTCRS